MTENSALSDHFARTGWSRGELARQVRARARAQGYAHVACDTSSVRRWFAGQVPRPPVGELIADLFSERLRLRVTTYDLGLAATPTRERALVYDRSFPAALEAVTDLGRADADRRANLVASAFVATAAVAPSRDWLLAVLDHRANPAGPERSRGRDRGRDQQRDPGRREDGDGSQPPVSGSDGPVLEIAFQEPDVWSRGESGRRALAAYLNEHVYPLLRVERAEPARTALLAAAAEQTCLLGRLAADQGAHGIAQRYLVQALRLAQEAHDPALGAHVLACLADQAILLGHVDEGARLAQSGRLGLPRGGSAACLADLCALEARAHALLGNRAAALQALARSEAALGAVHPAAEPAWARFVDPAYLYSEYAQVLRDLNLPSKANAYARRAARAAEERVRTTGIATPPPGVGGRAGAARTAWSRRPQLGAA